LPSLFLFLILCFNSCQTWAKEEPIVSQNGRYRYENIQEFFTELFFLTHSTLRLGPLRTIENYLKLIQSISDLQHEKSLSEELHQRSNYSDLRWKMVIDQLNEKLEGKFIEKLLLEVHLLDAGMSIVDFYSFTASWLIQISLVSSESMNEDFESWTQNIPRIFSVVPEWIIENMADYFIFVCRFHPRLLLQATKMDPVITLFVLLMGSSHHLRNPYLRSKFAEVLFSFSCVDEEATDFQMTTVGRGLWRFFDTNIIARNFLLPSLISLYVDIETTGRHMQFYEKFSVRRNISILIKHLRDIPYHNNRMKDEPIRNPQFFLKFVHRLLDDSIYLLDELILKAKEAIDIETQMKSGRNGRTTNPEEHGLINRQRQITGIVGYYSRHANEIVDLLHSITHTNPEVFLRPENVDRIAGMLNYFLKKLVGQSRLAFLTSVVKNISFQPFILFRQVCLSFVIMIIVI
jgi:ubiquitin conjugation factor E4 B